MKKVQYVSVRQAAGLAGCSVDNIYRAIKSGELRNAMPRGLQIAFLEQDVLAWIRKPRRLGRPVKR